MACSIETNTVRFDNAPEIVLLVLGNNCDSDSSEINYAIDVCDFSEIIKQEVTQSSKNNSSTPPLPLLTHALGVRSNKDAFN